MNFNKSTEYAFRILGFLALDERKIYSTDEIYNKVKIPYRYLRKQLTNLTKKGLINSVQGKHGGYRLTKKKSEISLYDIVVCMEDGVLSTECFFGYTDCHLIEKCAMHDKWEEISSSLNNLLKTMNLADITRKEYPAFF